MLDFLSIDPGSLIFTLLNTLILFLVIKHFLFKPVLGILEQRQAEVDDTYEKADHAKESAEKLEADYTVLMQNAKEESAEMIKAATKTAQTRSDEIIADAKREANAVSQRAAEEIERDKARAKAQLRGEISDLALLAAEQVVKKDLSTQDHERLISDFIDNIGEFE